MEPLARQNVVDMLDQGERRCNALAWLRFLLQQPDGALDYRNRINGRIRVGSIGHDADHPAIGGTSRIGPQFSRATNGPTAFSSRVVVQSRFGATSSRCRGMWRQRSENRRNVRVCTSIFSLVRRRQWDTSWDTPEGENYYVIDLVGVPKGIRTPVAAVKGQCPRPLDDGDVVRSALIASSDGKINGEKAGRRAVLPGSVKRSSGRTCGGRADGAALARGEPLSGGWKRQPQRPDRPRTRSC